MSGASQSRPALHITPGEMMRPIFIVLVLTAIVSCAVNGTAGVLSQDLADAVDALEDGQLIRVYVKPDHTLDLTGLQAQAAGLAKEEKRAFVIETLKSAAEWNHAGILAILEEDVAVGNAKDVRSLWLANVIGLRATKQVIAKLAADPLVKRVYRVRRENALLDAGHDHHGLPLIPMPDTVWNIGLVEAPCAWEQGYTGAGVVVGHFDTGVNYDHVDLADHVWVNSAETPGNMLDDDSNGYIDDYYGYDFANDDSDPADDHGHGAHTAGTVAGDGTAGRNTGVAPDAQIMSLKVLDWWGSGTEFDTWEAIQYAVDMGADVLTFSMGWLYYTSPDRATWRGTFDGVVAAGISTAAAAGNEGQYWLSPFWYEPPENLRTPGDVPPPWLHPDQLLTGGVSGVVSVGATDASDILADFSSIGPVSWSLIAPYLDYPYNPEMGLLDPDVCAPGVDITSLSYISDNSYVGGPSWSGTSMSCPHVAGLMALMLSKNPSLTPAEIDSIIETTAIELGAPGKDNEYGSGRIDVCDAINATPLGIQEETLPRSRRSSIKTALEIAPNPFRTTVNIAVRLGAGHGGSSLRSVSFYDTGGRLVRELDVPKTGGGIEDLTLSWDGTDSYERPVNAGIYFLKVETGTGVLTDKVVLLR